MKTAVKIILNKKSNKSCSKIVKRKYVENPKILITGSSGQIGTELSEKLREKFGAENVISSDIKKIPKVERDKGPARFVDVTDRHGIEQVVAEENVDWILHLSSVLSATGERNVDAAIGLNIRGIENVLNVATKYGCKVYAPSSIAAFGPSTPLDNTPDNTIMRPKTIYGVSKVYLELLGEYYQQRFGVDFRSLRYPGIISYASAPGGGTTDYAVDIFYHAIQGIPYKCFLAPDTRLPMMYMPDCLQGTFDFICADKNRLTQSTYNITAVSFTPEEIAEELRKHYPGFKIEYAIDFRNDIALSWPHSLDDSIARRDWNWDPKYDLAEMTEDMIRNIKLKIGQTD